ncbi:uncharacterized protein LOC134256777 [Saccostrea cucullata]|uniref:uncharacterized protein LOC134256777 n=1 Tax=Saccostrea cuccullata TaxID=36930 RepID=UPI002ED42CB2
MEELKKKFKEATLSGNEDDISKLVQSLINNNEDLTTKDKCHILGQGLYDSILSGSCTIGIIKLFEGAGVDLSFTDPLGQSLLLKSVGAGRSRDCSNLVKYLVQNGADINHENINGQTDFLHLFTKGRLPNLFLVELIDNVSNIFEKDLLTGGTFLHLIPNCRDENKILLIKKLLEKGIPINSTDNNGDTPLHVMANFADVESFECLIDNEADVFAKNRLGETPFHYIASNTHVNEFQKLMELLLKKGLDVNDKDNSGKTLMHHALMSKETTVEGVSELLNQKVALNVKDNRGRNEIYCAVEEVDISYEQIDMEQRADVIKYLVKAGVSVNERNVDGISPLHLATLKNDLDILVALLDCGADVTQRTKTGATALHWACKNYNMLHVIIHFVLDGNYNLNVVDIYGSTALHWAVWFKEKSSVQTLLQIGSDYTLKDKAGNNPEVLAKKLNFAYFSDLIDGKKFQEMDFLELQVPNLECSGIDPLIACPHLRYMRKENDKLYIEEYLNHLKLHESSIQSCLQRSLTLSEMGLFYSLEDNHLVPKKIHQLFMLLAENISTKYPSFTCKVKLAGSMYEGTKVRIPDEFDYLFIFSNLSGLLHPAEDDTFPESFVKIRIRSGEQNSPYDKYLTSDGFLDSHLLLQDFYKCVNEELGIILKENDDYCHIVLLKSMKEIWNTISELKFLVFGQEAKFFYASIDIVPALQFADWAPKHLHRQRKDICQTETVDRYSTVIMKTPDRCHVKDFTLFFRISYSYLEQSIIKDIPNPVKKSYILLKILTESGYFPKVVDHDFNRAVKTYITSYHLKTCLLHEWYEWTLHQDKSSTKTQDNQNDVSIVWARKILHRFQNSVEKKFLPSFFNPNKNLFAIEAMNDGMREQDEVAQLGGLLVHILNVATCKKENLEKT